MTTFTPYLCTTDARAALVWYGEAFGAVTTVAPMAMDDGRVGHSEFTIGAARFMMSDPHPEIAVVPPAPAGVPVTLVLEVDDCDAWTDRARAAGATVDREPTDNPHGRGAVVRDPFGHRWMLIGPCRDAAVRDAVVAG